MSSVDENTAVFIISTKRKERSTVKSRVVSQTEPNSCVAEVNCVTKDKGDSLPVSVEALLDYHENNGMQHALLVYKKASDERSFENNNGKDLSKWRTDLSWWSFFNSGEGKGKFIFFTGDVAWAFKQLINSQEADGTAVLLGEVLLKLLHNGKRQKVPFWLGLSRVVANKEKNIFDFEGVLRIRKDKFKYPGYFNWEIEVRGKFFDKKEKEKGFIHITGYRSYWDSE